jgi:DNA recombination protein RmuC
MTEIAWIAVIVGIAVFAALVVGLVVAIGSKTPEPALVDDEEGPPVEPSLNSEDLRAIVAEMLDGRLGDISDHIGRTASDLHDAVRSSHSTLSQAVTDLATDVERTTVLSETTVRHTEALRSTIGANHRRGRIGEVALANLLSTAGVSFTTQESLTGDNGRDRPDAVVQLPHGASLVVDAKFPTIGDDVPDDQMARVLSDGFRRAVGELGRKSYQERIPESLPFVVMLLPQVGAVADVEIHRPGSVAWAINQRVLPTDPSSLPTVLSLISTLDRMWSLPSEWSEVAELLASLHADEASLRRNLNVVRDGLHSIVPALRAVMQSVQDADAVLARIGALTGQSAAPKSKAVGVRLSAPAPLPVHQEQSEGE